MDSKKIVLFFILILVTIVIVTAKQDITLTLSQKEYYFKIGAPAILNLQAQNTYDQNISGQLIYSITQIANTQNSQSSSTSQNSIPFKIPKENNTFGINLGTSENPITFEMKLLFEYYKDESKTITLDNIKINFVQEDSENKNQENQQQSSSENEKSQMQQQMNQQMQQMQQQDPKTSQKLTNSQTSQDSSALKEQIQKQAQKKEAQKKAFKKTLEQNQQIQQEHKKMLDQEYQIKNMETDPKQNNSGSFEMNYEKENGNKAQIKGEMENDEITSLQTTTTEEEQEAIKKLEENEKFQKMSEQLKNENFQNTKTKIKKEGNKTKIEMQYSNEKNETAKITAEIRNETVQNIKLEKDKSNPWYFLMIPILIITLLIFHKKYKFGKKDISLETPTKTQKPFNYKKESKQLLMKSKKDFSEERYKDAYEKSSQAIRLFLSYKYNLKKDSTNDEIIKHLKSIKKETGKIKNRLDLCSLVEFAKYKPNKKDFGKITTFAEELIK